LARAVNASSFPSEKQNIQRQRYTYPLDFAARGCCTIPKIASNNSSLRDAKADADSETVGSFSEAERRKMLAFLLHLTRRSYGDQTLAALHRKAGFDWTSIYFCVGAGVAFGWIRRERIGRSTVIILTPEGETAMDALRKESVSKNASFDPHDNNDL
jgi:hypothetical protein